MFLLTMKQRLFGRWSEFEYWNFNLRVAYLACESTPVQGKNSSPHSFSAAHRNIVVGICAL